jgi:asparagine synthase (glutamine-hydrolysing)
MSGIVGIINLDGQPVDRQLLRQMTEFMTYRGPDAQEVWVDGPVGLGHALLQTTEDTPPECQPHTLDGQVWITADARIDARADLIGKLSGRVGNDPQNATDPELILHAYHVWGEDCLDHLLGDFAFAIWDGRKRRLFCARDHLGVKPFYYARVGGCLIFSNTLDCVRVHPQVSDDLNELAIADFLLFDFNQDQATTTFADIQRLPSAHSMTWEDTVLRVRRYWTLPQDAPLRYPRQQDYVDHFKELLEQAVADRLRTRRVGVMMSGGLDSSIVAATARRVLSAAGVPFEVRAHTAVFDRLIPDEEHRYAGLVAEHLNIPIHYQVSDDYALCGRWDQPELQRSEPGHDPMLAVWYGLIDKAARRTRVILTGQGGDDLLRPPETYFYRLLKEMHLGRLAVEVGRCVLIHGYLPRVGLRSRLRNWLGGGTMHDKVTRAMPGWLNPEFAARLDLEDRWERFRRAPDLSNNHSVRPEAYHGLMNPFWQDIFEKVYDGGVTGYPLEFRHPLLDLRLVSSVLALPPLSWCTNKLLFREAGRGLLPEAVRLRPKSPLAADPVQELLKRSDAHCVDHFIPHPELAAFVQRAAIPSLGGGNNPSSWINLRPFSLNCWLNHLRSHNYRQIPDSGMFNTLHTGGRP